MTRRVEVRGLSKRFGATQALINMNLTGTPGQVHAVVGENGAGKSTLMKVLSGVYKPDSGTLSIAGKALRFAHPRDAQNAGISTIFQEFSLLPNLSVSENLFLGREHQNGRLLARREIEQRTRDALATLDLRIDPNRRVGSLGVGAQQMVEIAKGLLTDASVFIFDEPTAALAAHEVTTLFKLIRRLASEEKVIFYISHRLSEIFIICNDITVMKDGRLVVCLDVADTSVDALIGAMVGRHLEQFFEPRNAAPGDPLLVVDRLASAALPAPVSFSVRSGEIVGLAGLEGQGQSELMRLLAGFDHATSGRMSIEGQPVQEKPYQGRVAAGLGFVPENRKEDGVFASLDIRANMETAINAQEQVSSIAPGLTTRIAAIMAGLSIKAPGVETRVADLSGGNQQKVILGRWLLAGSRVLLCEEPTRGVDIGAKREIYAELRKFTNVGNGILVSSRELPELIGLCDRILVLCGGCIVADVQASEASEGSLLRAALPQSGSMKVGQASERQ